MIVNVQMLAFADAGVVRKVEIPDKNYIYEILETVFKYGQNDFQPKKCPSVSVGDVIELGKSLYVVCPVGFHKLTEDEYQDYLITPRLDRFMKYYDFKVNV